jgi:hypothetical protein
MISDRTNKKKHKNYEKFIKSSVTVPRMLEISVTIKWTVSGSQPLWGRGPVSSFFIRRGPSPKRFTRKHLSSFVKSSSIKLLNPWDDYSHRCLYLSERHAMPYVIAKLLRFSSVVKGFLELSRRSLIAGWHVPRSEGQTTFNTCELSHISKCLRHHKQNTNIIAPLQPSMKDSFIAQL